MYHVQEEVNTLELPKYFQKKGRKLRKVESKLGARATVCCKQI
jgi:hypothetical protein